MNPPSRPPGRLPHPSEVAADRRLEGKDMGEQRKTANQGGQRAASAGEGAAQVDLERPCAEFGNRARRKPKGSRSWTTPRTNR